VAVRRRTARRAGPTTASVLTPKSVAIEVKAEMVASVFKVLVAAGASVAAGEALVILESMKMEIPVLADAAGTVDEVCVAEGDVVHEGDVLVVIG